MYRSDLKPTKGAFIIVSDQRRTSVSRVRICIFSDIIWVKEGNTVYNCTKNAKLLPYNSGDYYGLSSQYRHTAFNDLFDTPPRELSR